MADTDDARPNLGSAALRAAYKPRVPIGVIAKRVGVSTETVRRWSKAQATPPADAMAVLEDLLGIPMRAWTQGAPPADDSGPTVASADGEDD